MSVRCNITNKTNQFESTRLKRVVHKEPIPARFISDREKWRFEKSLKKTLKKKTGVIQGFPMSVANAKQAVFNPVGIIILVRISAIYQIHSSFFN